VFNTPLGKKYKCKHETVVMQVGKTSFLFSVFIELGLLGQVHEGMIYAKKNPGSNSCEGW
jgi:hypothetical protein